MARGYITMPWGNAVLLVLPQGFNVSCLSREVFVQKPYLDMPSRHGLFRVLDDCKLNTEEHSK